MLGRDADQPWHWLKVRSNRSGRRRALAANFLADSSTIRGRILAGLDRVRQREKQLGRPKVSPNVEVAIREHLGVGYGVLKVAALVGVGSAPFNG